MDWDEVREIGEEFRTAKAVGDLIWLMLEHHFDYSITDRPEWKAKVTGKEDTEEAFQYVREQVKELIEERYGEFNG